MQNNTDPNELVTITYDDLEIGGIYLGEVKDVNGIMQSSSFTVLEKVTKEEYLAYCKERNVMNQVTNMVHYPGVHFYRLRILD